jgi:hypothetical protein
MVPEPGLTVVEPIPTPVISGVVPLKKLVAVITPAENPPAPFLETIVEFVLSLVALEVTVNVDAPELLNVVEPESPVPEVLRVNVFCKFPLNVVAVTTPAENPPAPFLETIVEFVLSLVAFDATVNVEFPD